MQYNPESEKVAMMGSSYTPVPKPLSRAEDPQIQRTRKMFMIIVGVCLVSFVFFRLLFDDDNKKLCFLFSLKFIL